MNNFDYITKENIKENNPTWPKFSIIKTEYWQLGALYPEKKWIFTLISQKIDIDKIYL